MNWDELLADRKAELKDQTMVASLVQLMADLWADLLVDLMVDSRDFELVDMMAVL